MSLKDKIIDKVSNVMSYPARNKAARSMAQDEYDLKAIKSSRAVGNRMYRDPSGELISVPPGTKPKVNNIPKMNFLQKAASFVTKPLVKELKMQDAANIKNKAAGQAANKAYSGFKYGVQIKKTK